MKRRLFLLIVSALVSIGTWAATDVQLSDGTLTITTTEAGTLSNYSFTDEQKAATTIVLAGKFSSTDLEAINRNHGFTSVKTVNMKEAEFPKQSTGNTNYLLLNTLPATSENMYGDKYVVGGTYYVSSENNGSWEWSESTYSDNQQVQARYATFEEAPAPSGNDQKMVVGGTVYQPVHDWNSNPQTHTWQEVGAGDNNDWTQMAFGGWEGLETIILPDNFNVESGKNYNNFYGNNKSTLQRIERGDSYALIGSSNNNYTAEIYCADDDRANMKAIVGLDNFVTQDANITYANPNDHDYITWNEETGVYDVHVTSAGSLKSKYEKLLRDAGQNALEGAVFRFDSECTGFTAEDLQALAHANGPYVYVDFYNVTATEAVETAIRDALKGNDSGVNALANNQHYKGLLLPSDPQQIGTALIANTGSSSPVSDFIAYKSGTSTVAHIYDTSASDESKYEPKVTALKGIMDAHSDIASETSVYLVSTNCKTPIANVESIKGTSTTASIVHTYNNEMVNPDATNPTKPCIEVIPAAAGDYATLNEATNMRNTPNTDVLKFKGAINTDDILAVNSFTQTHWDNTTNSYVENDPKVYNGPRVLDLSEVDASLITQNLLNNLENPEIEYIILPAGMEAPVVGDYPKLANLKCVISSDNSTTEGDKVLNAYVKVAGSLAEARCLTTGNDDGGGSTFKPTAQSLTKVKLSGNLNHNDISTKGDTSGLKDEYTTVTSIDLSDAYFANVDDMRLGNEGDGRPGAGFNQSNVLTEVILPTTMTEIPSYCLYGIKSLKNLHIPYNYTKIGWAAFWESGIDHITTEDALNGALVDNGPKTYTLSAAITELGAPNQQESIAVFPQTVGVTDVYCLGTTAPVCYAHTFHADITYGQGGMNDGIYCREKYQKDSKVIAVLHFPSLESYKNATGSENGYADMVSLYTDPTRAYSKKDQTGAVDANGNPLVWPDQGELMGSRNMALAGYIWEDYPDLSYQEEGDHHLISIGTPTGSQEAFYPNYVGWHEFVLSLATYVEPEEIIEDEKIVREYVETDWYTFCIPFDMTVSQVQEMLGVPASTDKVICKLNGQEVTEAIMPDIRQLQSVTREKGVGTARNYVRLYLTENLWNGTEAEAHYLDFGTGDDNGQKLAYAATDAKPDRCLVGGRPYVIKAYRRAGDQFKIKGQNLGKYIMTRYGDEFGKEASCVENGLYEQLYNGAGNGLVTLRFAIPYENHKVRAVKYGENATYLEYDVNGTAYHYNYTMVGQYWQQPLPQYCFYMSKGKWYRYSTPQTDKNGNPYTWDPYKCIIMATPEIDDTEDHPMSGKYRDNDKSVYPTVVAGTDDLLEENFSLTFLDGRDDDDFDQMANAKYVFTFDDGITEFDENGNEVTAIESIDGESTIEVPGNGKVYNMSGQMVGKSVGNLGKGLYIVNGKKVVIK